MTRSIPKKVAVIGASGYSGEELLRLLGQHPGIEVACITSRQYAGKPLGEIQPQFRGHPVLGAIKFSDSDVEGIVASGAEFVFLALPHGLAAEFAGPLLRNGLRVLDLSADFRLHDPAVFEEFYHGKHPAPELLGAAVYGMPEIHRSEITRARLVACPGCYPTTITLPLVPLLKRGLLDPKTIIANSLSGVSGAGRKADVGFLFVECNESARAYGVPVHRHLSEIEQELSLAAGETVRINFAPHLIPLNRGMITTIHVNFSDSADIEAVTSAFEADYGSESFVRLLGASAIPDAKHVFRTNFIDIGWRFDTRTGRLILLSAIDNLTKGAAGQAVQCFNLLAGFPETTGLL
ncbi:MAG TPA: N-acetyl-gamma-glutamyl-phosphate reductase [Chthoniobacterales bacterium]